MDNSDTKKSLVALLSVTVMGTGCTIQSSKDDTHLSNFFNDLQVLPWVTSEGNLETRQVAFSNDLGTSPDAGDTAPAPVLLALPREGDEDETDQVASPPPVAELPPVEDRSIAPPTLELAIAPPIGGYIEPDADSIKQTPAEPEVESKSRSEPKRAAKVPAKKPAPVVVETRAPVPKAKLALVSDDLWMRIRASLAIPASARPELKPHLKWLRDHPRYFEKISARATPYLYHIIEEVERRGMPAEMALVPIVESGFQPFAYSSSGAAGLWQIIPSTGRHLGLKQNWWYDGRRDIVQSTDAALNYLQRLHKHFGDWALAFAAYNCGKGAVSRAQAKSRAKGLGEDFWSIRPLLPRETRGYVPRLLAIALATRQPDAFGLKLSPIPNRRHFRVVKTDSQVDLGLAAELAGISASALRNLNPGFKRWATDPDGPHRLLVPSAKAKLLVAAIEKIPPTERVTWRIHTIARGETLGQIARSYGTRVDVLKQVNKLGDTRIGIGKNLMVPVQKGANKKIANASIAQASKAMARASKRDRGSSGRAPKGTTRYVVQSGDSLWSIARQHRTRVDAILKINALSSAVVLRPGQHLWIPKKRTAAVAKSIRVAATVERRVHTVRTGDSLWDIAREFDVEVDQLRLWNGLDRKDVLKPGQRLYLSAPSNRRQS